MLYESINSRGCCTKVRGVLTALICMFTLMFMSNFNHVRLSLDNKILLPYYLLTYGCRKFPVLYAGPTMWISLSRHPRDAVLWTFPEDI